MIEAAKEPGTAFDELRVQHFRSASLLSGFNRCDEVATSGRIARKTWPGIDYEQGCFVDRGDFAD